MKWRKMTLIVLVVFLLGLSACNNKVNRNIPDNMEKVNADHFSTVKEKSWIQIDNNENLDEIILKPNNEEQTSFFVRNFLYLTMTSENKRTNLLLDNFRASNSNTDFEKKMIETQKKFGPSETVEEIGTIDGTTIFGGTIGSGYLLKAYPVVDDIPFNISMQCFDGIDNLDKVKEKGYYDIFLDTIKNTFPN